MSLYCRGSVQRVCSIKHVQISDRRTAVGCNAANWTTHREPLVYRSTRRNVRDSGVRQELYGDWHGTRQSCTMETISLFHCPDTDEKLTGWCYTGRHFAATVVRSPLLRTIRTTMISSSVGTSIYESILVPFDTIQFFMLFLTKFHPNTLVVSDSASKFRLQVSIFVIR